MIDNIGGTLDWVSETPNNLGSADGQSGGGGGRPLWQLSTSCLILAIEKGVFSGIWVAAGKLLLTLEVEVVVTQGHGGEDPLDEFTFVLQRQACKGFTLRSPVGREDRGRLAIPLADATVDGVPGIILTLATPSTGTSTAPTKGTSSSSPSSPPTPHVESLQFNTLIGAELLVSLRGESKAGERGLYGGGLSCSVQLLKHDGDCLKDLRMDI